jgi:pimeloyl-ACP methyl ester carboxylesterase
VTGNERSHAVPTGLGTLNVRVVGDGRPAAVLWHSLFVDSRSWWRVEDALGRQRTLVLVDGPSHGGSQPAARTFTLADCAVAAEGVLDHLEVSGPVDWVGNAWGGHVGMTFAARRPERTRSLMTLASPVAALTAAERRRILPLVGIYRLAGAIRPARNGVVEALLTAEVRRNLPSAAELIDDVIKKADRRGLYLAMRSVMLGRPDLSDLLPRIEAPTVLAAGDDDPMLTTVELARAAEALPHGQTRTIAGSRHLAPVEAPDEVISLVTKLWGATAGDGGS